MINEGFAGGGISKSSRKRHLKEIYHVGEGSRSPDLPTISFTKEDAAGIIPGHDDPVVITIIVANANLHRTLVDQGCSADILFKSAFDKLGLEEKELRAYPQQPIRARRRSNPAPRIHPATHYLREGSPVQDAKHRLHHSQCELHIQRPHRPDNHKPSRCGSLHSTLVYEISNNGRGKETNAIKLRGAGVREELCPQPKGKTEVVQVRDTPGKTTSIGTNLREDLKELLVKLLRENSDLFAWKAADMPSIDPCLICHKLAVYSGSRPIQQKRRKLGSERSQVMEEQVQALLEAGFIREVKYSLWLANVVLVKSQMKSGECA
ncbi:uncharacterized protein [Arachis hypogaea]|uniref:uncharacterized protein n=1 Tax=Arachis hypogaea TaxID=3818 RepID=UPI003B225E57